MKPSRFPQIIFACLVLLFGNSQFYPAVASPTAIGDNSGPPAFQVQNEAKALVGARGNGKTDNFTGSYGYSIPIEGAPARNGSQPPLALVYSSSGGNGWCGVGWSLETGYVERNTQDGSPVKYNTATIPAPMTQYDDGKGFIANIFGRTLKLKLVSGTEYRAEVDSDFSRFVFNTGANRWEMYDKSGNVFYFGQAASSRIANPKPGWSGVSATFRWALDEVQTATGDKTTVAYTTTGTERMIYPTTISYNAHVSRNGYGGSWAATHTITFATDTARTDKTFSYRSGFRIEHNKRLTTITCAVNGSQVRKYALGYGSVSTATKRSLLRTLNIYGSDNTPLPTQNFTYQGNSVPVSFQSAINWNQMYLAYNNNVSERCLIGADSGAAVYDIIDVDGDGLPDRVRWNNTGTTQGSPPDNYLVQRNSGLQAGGLSGQFDNSIGGGGYPFSPTSTANIPKGNYWSALNAPNLRFLDVNRDGLPDRVADDSTWQLGGSFTYTKFFVQTNLGNAFSTSYAWPVDTYAGGTSAGYPFAAIEFFDSASFNAAWMRLLDINGDGFADRVMAQRLTSPARDSYFVELGTGNGFEMNGTTPAVKKFGPFTSQGVTSSSLNWFGAGSDYVYLADINGDGLVDRVMLPKTGIDSPVQGSTLNKFIVEYNNGYTFEQGPAGATDWGNVNPQYTASNPNRYSYPQMFPRVGLLDLNGDGLPDRVMTKEGDPTKWLVQLNTGTGFEAGAGYEVTINNQGRTVASDDEWFGIQGAGSGAETHSGQTVTAMMDMDGDGLLDRVYADYATVTASIVTGPISIKVQRNAGPYPDLLTGVTNGIGGTTTITYKPSTAWDNRKDPTDANSGKLLPFPVQTVNSISENDGVNTARTTTYVYEGGFYDGGRREFAGFAKVAVTDASNRKQIYYFHQGGGQERGTLGEYADVTSGFGNFAKRGMAYRIEIYGNDTPTPKLYNLVVNQVDQASPSAGRYFPFVSETFNYDYTSAGNARITCKKFDYDTATGNLTKTTGYGEVNAPTFSATTIANPSDTTGADTRYTHIIYATISGNSDIKDRPAIVKLTSDSGGGTILQEKNYTYSDANPSTPTLKGGTLWQEKTRICLGQYAITTYDEYDAWGLATRITDPVGVQTKINSFDGTYHIYPATTRIRVAPGSDSANDHITTTTYDARSGLLLTTKDIMDINLQNTYDAFFRLTRVDKGITPNGPATALWVKQVTYNLGGMTSGNSANYVRVLTQDGANGFDTWTYADGFGRPIQTKTEAEVATQYRAVNTVYNEQGEAYLTTWPRIEGNANFSKPPTTPNYPAAYTGYDAAGRINLTHPRANATFTFNGSGIQTVTTSLTGGGAGGDAGTSPLASKTWSYVNGTDPWWIVCTDEDTKVRRYRLDAFGQTNRIEEVYDAVGNYYATTLNYDLAGNLTEIINSITPVENADHIYYGYDDAGNVVAMADPHLGQWTYRRDAAGRIREQTDAKGQKVVFTYGATLSRLSTKQVYNAAAQLVSTVNYTYDTSDDGNYTVYKGQLYRVVDSEGSEKNDYDTRGRLRKTTRHLNINGQDYSTTYTYNDGDKITSTVYPNSGLTINYEYHPSGALWRVSRAGSAYYYYTAPNNQFDEFGHVLQFTYGNGLYNNRSYYPTSKRLQTISAGTSPGSSSVMGRSYQYTAADDVKYLSGTGLGSGMTVTYDNLHRVQSYSALASGNFTYDSVGNMTYNREPDTGYSSGSALTYGVRRTQAVKSAYGKTYLYDKCGNLIVRRGGTTGAQALDYDAENRLVRFSQAGAVMVEYGYSAGGQRLWKRVNQDPNKLQVWIGNIYEEKEQGGTRKTLFHVFAGGQRICTFELGSALAVNGGGGAATHVGYYYHQDHLGSSSVMSGSAGQQLEVNVYYPFGRTQTANPQAAFKVSNQFTGQVKDEETGLYYYGARYYDPELGRFIQPDTLIPDLSNPQSYNRYSYVLNNPLRYTDPTGNAPEDDDFDVPLTLGAAHAAQRRAMSSGSAQLYDKSLGEMKTGAAVGRAAAEMNPIVGGFNSASQLITGKDAIDAHQLTTRERVLSGVDVGLQGSGKALKIAAGTGAAVTMLMMADKFGDASRTTGKLRKVEKIASGPAFPGLKDHALRHSNWHPNAYYDHAVKHMETGTQFTFKHAGENRLAFVTRLGSDQFAFTSTSMNKKTIFTHYPVSTQTLKNMGITLPKDF